MKKSYSTVKNKVLKYWWVVIVAILIGFIIPLLINEAYKVDNGYITFWGASDMLTFYGELLGFAGTIALGALALYQNNRLTKLEEQRFVLELQPFITVTDWKVNTIDSRDEVINPTKTSFHIETVNYNKSDFVGFSLFFTNTGNTFSMVNYTGAKLYDNNNLFGEWGVSSNNQQNSKISLHIGDTGEIVFICTKDKMKSFSGKKIVLELVLENKMNERYKETIDIICGGVYENNNIWTTYLSPQNYKIRKFIKDNKGNIILEKENIY